MSFRLLTMCTRHFGSVVTQTIRTYKTDQFPLLLIVMGKRTSNEVLNVIQGNYYFIDNMINCTMYRFTVLLSDWCKNRDLNTHFRIVWLFFISLGNTTVDELMMRLMGAMEIFTAQQQEDIKDEVRSEHNQEARDCSETQLSTSDS